MGKKQRMHSPTILCVDHDPSILVTLSSQLRQQFPHCAIEIAESGETALVLVEQLKTAGIDVPLVIADQSLPGMPGDDLLIELHARYPDTLTVMLTDQSGEAGVLQVVQRGRLYRWLTKPWQPLDLLLTVTEVLRCYQQTQELEQVNRQLAANTVALQQLHAELENRVRQGTQDLTRSEQDLRTIFNHVYDAIVIHDLDGTILDVNDRALELHQATRDQLLAATVADLLAPGEPVDSLHTIFEQVQSGQMVQLEGRNRRFNDHSTFETEVSLRQITLGNRPVIMAGVRDISDRKQTEAVLQSERLRLHLALDAADMGTWESNLDTGIWSERTEAIFGYAPGTFPGDREAFLKLVHREDQDRVFGALHQSFVTGSPYNVEYRINRLDGELRWIAVSGKVVANEDGSNRRIVGITLDITERKQAEESVRLSQEQLQLALEGSGDGVWDWDIVTGEADLSPRWLGMLNYEVSELPGCADTWESLIHLEDKATVLQALQAHLRDSSVPYQVEYRAQTKEGRWRWIANYGRVVARDPDGTPLRMVGLQRDITDRKQAEIALRESQLFLQTVIDTFPLVVFWKDCNSVYLGCNQKSALAAGLTSPADIVGKTDYDLPWGATEADFYRADDRRVLESGEARLGIIETQIRADGSEIWIETNKLPLYNLSGELIGVLGTYQDITERKLAEQALQQLNLELEQRVSDRTLELQKAMEAAEMANKAKSTFLANMSHELRTPLNTILGFAQLLSRDGSLDPEKRKQLSIINRSGKHLLSLINDILEMSKIEAGRSTFIPNRFDLQAQINMLDDMFQLRAWEKGLQFIIDQDPALPGYVETDENKLRQILINLIGNAIKFTETGYVRLRIHLDGSFQPTSADTLTLYFAVEDTGPGIDPAELESLFEPFIQSGNRQQSQEGTGLGLPISRQFVQLLGGELVTTSVLGSGSTFAFAIPVSLVPTAEVPSAAIRPILRVAPDQPAYRILVVEDNELNGQMLVQLLQSVGFDVRSARNGEQAIAEWETWQPHLIWMDMQMPVLDGYAATRQIRAREQEPTTVIIALTSNAFEEDRAKVLAAGCNDFVRKPFQDNELLKKMADYLRVEYLYADEVDTPPDLTWGRDLAIAELQTLPPTVLAQLHQATLQLDGPQLMQLAVRLSSQHPKLAGFLTEKVDNFAFDQIFQLLQQVIP